MYWVSVYQYFSRFDVVKSHQKVSQGTFPRAALSNDESRLPCREVEAGTIQGGLIGSGRIGE